MRDTLVFTANLFEALEEKYTEDFSSISIHFAMGNPENGGHHWSFSRASDNEQVCITKEIQQATIYEGIEHFQISRNRIECKFNTHASNILALESLTILFDMSPEKWKIIAEATRKIFHDKAYFTLM